MESRKALITGASSGIGAATARQLASEGYSVWLTYTSNEKDAASVAEQCRQVGAAEVHHSRLDLRAAESIADLIDEVMTTWGSLHVLVNNGGVCPYRAFDDIEQDEWDAVMETNARGTFFVTRAALSLLRKSEGDRSIVNISSIAGEIGSIHTAFHYAASKGAILAISKSFAKQLAAEQIRVNSVAPGPVTTAITDQLEAEKRDALSKQVPLGAFGEPEDVAWIISALASPHARFITGATYDVNGGVRIG